MKSSAATTRKTQKSNGGEITLVAFLKSDDIQPLVKLSRFLVASLLKDFKFGKYLKTKHFRDFLFPKTPTFLAKLCRHYKIFCVNGNTGFKFESRIFYFIHLQNEENYERKESSSAR